MLRCVQVQKRRIYDITNVLEGVGLIEKKSKNNIIWKPAMPSGSPEDAEDQRALEQMQANMQQLRVSARQHTVAKLQCAVHSTICASLEERMVAHFSFRSTSSWWPYMLLWRRGSMQLTRTLPRKDCSSEALHECLYCACRMQTLLWRHTSTR